MIGRFVVDFCCPGARLVIELDGAVHETDEAREQDAWREEQLRELGYDVIRFRNHVVEQTPERAVEAIRVAIGKADERID